MHVHDTMHQQLFTKQKPNQYTTQYYCCKWKEAGQTLFSRSLRSMLYDALAYVPQQLMK